jgi:hypothetical protein
VERARQDQRERQGHRGRKVNKVRRARRGHRALKDRPAPLAQRDIMVVTASGDMQLQHASEVAAASTVMAGSLLMLTKVA